MEQVNRRRCWTNPWLLSCTGLLLLLVSIPFLIMILPSNEVLLLYGKDLKVETKGSPTEILLARFEGDSRKLSRRAMRLRWESPEEAKTGAGSFTVLKRYKNNLRRDLRYIDKQRSEDNADYSYKYTGVEVLWTTMTDPDLPTDLLEQFRTGHLFVLIPVGKKRHFVIAPKTWPDP